MSPAPKVDVVDQERVSWHQGWGFQDALRTGPRRWLESCMQTKFNLLTNGSHTRKRESHFIERHPDATNVSRGLLRDEHLLLSTVGESVLSSRPRSQPAKKLLLLLRLTVLRLRLHAIDGGVIVDVRGPGRGRHPATSRLNVPSEPEAEEERNDCQL